MSGVTASFARGGSLRTLVLDITNTASPNIPNLLSAAGWKGIQQPVIVENSALVNTLVIPNTLAGANITILNKSGARIGGVKNGGTALRTQIPINVDNQGIISGGGGRGKTGQTASAVDINGSTVYAYGGAGGEGEGFEQANSLNIVPKTWGSPGQTISYWGGSPGGNILTGGSGWQGGSWGEYGEPGVGYGGGTPGYHTDGNSLVTWINTGTRIGRVR